MEVVPWDYQDAESWPGPFVTVLLHGWRRDWRVSALFDTGAEFSCLSDELIDILGIPDHDLHDQKLQLADGSAVAGQLAFLNATVDGHTFTMPVVFSGVFEHDLFGRVGYSTNLKSHMMAAWRRRIGGKDRLKPPGESRSG